MNARSMLVFAAAAIAATLAFPGCNTLLDNKPGTLLTVGDDPSLPTPEDQGPTPESRLLWRDEPAPAP